MAKATFEDVAQVAGKQLYEAMSSTQHMGAKDFFRKGFGGQQHAQTRAALEHVKKGNAPDFTDSIAATRFGALKAPERKVVAAVVLCGRIPAIKKDGIGIAGPSIESQGLKDEVREAWQALRIGLAEFYGLDEVRKIYPRSASGVRVKMGAEDLTADEAPDTKDVEQEQQEEAI